MKSASIVAVFACLLCSVYAIHYGEAAGALRSFQAANGGFKNPGEEPSLSCTANAVLLASIYGVHDFNAGAVPGFVDSLRNSDNGYGNVNGASSSVEATSDALIVLKNLDLPVDGAAVSQYVNSLVDSKTGLVNGNIRETAAAFRIHHMLGESSALKLNEAKLSSFLKKNVASKAGKSHFDFDGNLDSLEENFYGVIVGKEVGFKFSPKQDWVSFVLGRATNDGGFSGDNGMASIDSTTVALSTLDLLDAEDEVNIENVRQYFDSVELSLENAADAHIALAEFDLSQNFAAATDYETISPPAVKNHQIVEGSQVRPAIAILSADGYSNGGLKASLAIEQEDESKTHDLSWSEKQRQYVAADYIEMAGSLGPVAFKYSFATHIPGLGELSFSYVDQMRVGYGINIHADASHDVTGSEIDVGGAVTTGTDFSFGITLKKRSSYGRDQIVSSGDFEIEFIVEDASGVVIYRENVDGESHSGPLSFDYSLRDQALPSGSLVFRFEVSDKPGNVHTSDSVSYFYESPMVAANIGFSQKPEFKFGESASVTMTPGVLADLREFQPLSQKDYDGNDITAQRNFILELVTPGGIVLATLPYASSTGGNYIFNFDIPNVLDYLGTTVLRFRHVSDAATVTLVNFDADAGLLFEHESALNFTVAAELHATFDKELTKKSLSYGNEVEFDFTVTDSVSGNAIGAGKYANAFLVFNYTNKDDNKQYTSAEQAAVFDGSSYSINWQVNPNAVKGKGVIGVKVTDADGQYQELYKGKKNARISYDVTIGGEINKEVSVHSSGEVFAREAAFVAELALTSQGKLLRGAKLTCSVFRDSELVAELPVAISSEGGYSVSWTQPLKNAKSGSYELQFYRQIDRDMARARQLFKEKQLKRERREKELKGEAVSSEDIEVELELEPFFVVNHHHKASSKSKLPFRTEFFALVAFWVLFYFAFKGFQKY